MTTIIRSLPGRTSSSWRKNRPQLVIGVTHLRVVKGANIGEPLGTRPEGPSSHSPQRRERASVDFGPAKMPRRGWIIGEVWVEEVEEEKNRSFVAQGAKVLERGIRPSPLARRVMRFVEAT